MYISLLVTMTKLTDSADQFAFNNRSGPQQHSESRHCFARQVNVG